VRNPILTKRRGREAAWDEAIAKLVAKAPGLRARELAAIVADTLDATADADMSTRRALARLEESGVIVRRNGQRGTYYAAEGSQEAVPWPTGRET